MYAQASQRLPDFELRCIYLIYRWMWVKLASWITSKALACFGSFVQSLAQRARRHTSNSNCCPRKCTSSRWTDGHTVVCVAVRDAPSAHLLCNKDTFTQATHVTKWDTYCLTHSKHAFSPCIMSAEIIRKSHQLLCKQELKACLGLCHQQTKCELENECV